jgi:hypothetical protein
MLAYNYVAYASEVFHDFLGLGVSEFYWGAYHPVQLGCMPIQLIREG